MNAVVAAAATPMYVAKYQPVVVPCHCLRAATEHVGTMSKDGGERELGSVAEACAYVMSESVMGEDALHRIAFSGVDRVRLVEMAQKPLNDLLTYLLRRARAVSGEGAGLLVQAESCDYIPIPLSNERRLCRCVRLSIDDKGAPVQASEIAKAMWWGLAERKPGNDLLAWAYHLVREVGGHVSVERGPAGGNRVNCYLPLASES